jgi:hypothetical protein
MWPNNALSKSTSPSSVRILRRLHFRQHIGMAADGALAEDDQLRVRMLAPSTVIATGTCW